MPTVAAARIKLDQALRTAKARRAPALKIIHGYGSTGKGGAIGRDVRQYLGTKVRSGQLQGFVGGEDFSPFDSTARKLVEACPTLTKDRDYTRGNHGITMVLL